MTTSPPKSTLAAPPVRTPFPDAKSWQTAGTPSYGWMKWFQEITNAVNAILIALAANSIDAGTF